MSRVAVIAGNGPSLRDITPGSVTAQDCIIRTNSFFFEDHFWLGRRVDLAFIGGDPRVAPFLMQTLLQQRASYDLRAWATQDKRIAKHTKSVDLPAVPFLCRDRHMAAMLTDLMSQYDCTPMTGTCAAIAAHGLGFRRLVLTGMDLYADPRRYAFSTGANQRALLGQDLDHRGPDRRLHDPDLDRALIRYLRNRDDCSISCASPSSPLAEELPASPLRGGTPPITTPRSPPRDWSSRAGLYPIHLLRILRATKRVLRAPLPYFRQTEV